MRHQTVDDIGFLTARLHGRRSRLAEQEHLESLSHIRNLQDFMKAVLPEAEADSITDFQRQLVGVLASELAGFSQCLKGKEASLVDWLFTRFDVENLKLLVRAVITASPIEELKKHMVTASGTFFSELTVLPGSVPEIAAIIPKGPLRSAFEKNVRSNDETARAFYFETAIDSSYFQELSSRANRLGSDEQKIIRPVIDQYIDIFHVMLAMRGKYHYAFSSDLLMQFHVIGSRISRDLFNTMLHDSDPRTSVNRLFGYVIDQSMKHAMDDTPEQFVIQTLERMAWKRFLRLSNHAFRESHMGLGAVVGYVGIRMVEVANLITLSEAIKLDMPVDAICNRLIANSPSEAAYV